MVEDDSVWGLYKSRDASQPVNCQRQLARRLDLGCVVPSVGPQEARSEWIYSQEFYFEASGRRSKDFRVLY